MILQFECNPKPNNKPGDFLVSVVVPNFNHRRFLPERLRSIFTQTHRNLEIIFLDDASTDGSLDYVRSLKSPFPIQILPNEVNGGSVFRQWHRGITEARGEFVWIAESDDSCQPDLIEKLLAVAQRNSAIGIVYAQSRLIDENGKDLGSLRVDTDDIDLERWRRDYVNSGRDEAARYLVVRNTIPNASACLFRRTALLEADLPSIQLRVCGDWLAYARICERHAVAFVAESLNLFRRHESTVRAGARADGLQLAETYAVQTHITQLFDVPAHVREGAKRSTFSLLLAQIKQRRASNSFVDDRRFFEAAGRFDPELRDRLAGGPAIATVVRVRCIAADGKTEEHVRSYHPWKWVEVRIDGCRGAAVVVPLSSLGVVALRRIRVVDQATGAELWMADDGESYRKIGLSGSAHRIGSDDALEVLVWESNAMLQLDIPMHVTHGRSYRLELDVRLATLRTYDEKVADPSPTRRRVLMVLPHLELGGADRFNLDLIAELTRRFNWSVTVITTRPSEDSWAGEFRKLSSDVYLLHRFLDLSDYPAFIRFLIESRKPDVVFLSHSQFGYLLLPWLKSQFPALPVVDLVHITMPEWKSGGYPRFSIENRGWLDRTIATSQHLREWMLDRGHEADKIAVCYTSVDTELWRRSDDEAERARQRWDLDPARPVILYAARFCDQKNPRIIPAVIEGLLKRNRDFLLLIAGDGPDRPWLESNVRDRYVFHTRILGSLLPDEMRLLMSATDILLLPSENEGIAVSLYEALSMEVVPVATAVGGQSELIRPEFGVLLPTGPKLVSALIEAIAPLLVDVTRRKEMGRLGRLWVEQKHSLTLMGEGMHEIFLRVIESSFTCATPPTILAEKMDAFADSVVRQMRAEQAGEDDWAEKMRRGEHMPRLVSRLAHHFRQAPLLGKVARNLEKRYGAKIGRLILRWKRAWPLCGTKT